MEIKEAFKLGKDFYKNIEYADEYKEMKIILSNILNVDDTYFILHDDEVLNVEQIKKFFDILKERKSGVPLQYILGNQDFYKYNFIVDNGVLIPRYDTELSVETILSLVKDGDKMLEIGVGSGCVSISVALEKKLYIDAVDISDLALNNTIKNIKKFNLKNINVFKSNVYENVSKKYDIIYSNPPYIKSEEIKSLQKEVQHEPRLALDGGIDGLDIYRKIITNLENYLNECGYLILEIGFDQAADLKKLLEGYNICVLKDLSGHDRVIVATKGDLDVRKFRSF